jgi:CelD/BcsL family acetyltransferase involved in cellulose biosynthesis
MNPCGPGTGNLEVRLIEHIDDLAGLAAGWRALEQQGLQTSIFSTYDFIACSWTHFSTVRDHLHVIAVFQEGRLVAVAPLKLSIQRLYGTPARVADWIGLWDGDRPGVLTSLPQELCWALVGEELVRTAARWDLLELGEQAAELPLPARLRRIVYHQVDADAEGFAIRLDRSFDDYIAVLASSVRTNWRKRRRKLFEKMPDCVVERVDATPDKLGAALDRFIAIEKQSWKGDAGIGVGKDVQHRGFYDDWLGRLGPMQASLYFLRGDGADLAGLMVLRQGRMAYSRHITYAPAMSALSPAIALRAEVLRELCETGLSELDLLGMRTATGEQRHKSDWSTHHYATYHHALYRWRGRLMPVILAKIVKQGLRRVLARFAPRPLDA